MSGSKNISAKATTKDYPSNGGLGRRTFWVLLTVGVILRCIAINQPLLDAHLLRQCQTAAATQSLIVSPALSSEVPWSGTIKGQYVQELPLYNYLVIAVHTLLGNLDISGKVTSIALWAISFFLLQFVWRRLLDPVQTTWANLLFVFSPLSVFYGQAVMPEMLVQALSFAFLISVFRYNESPTLGRWSACAVVGVVALMVKLPEVAHLYLILAILVFRRESWKGLMRPRYLIAAGLTVAALKSWSSYIDSVNVGGLSFSSSTKTLLTFVGTWQSRFHLVPWVMISLYIGVFILAGLAAIPTAYGFWTVIKTRRPPLLVLWLISLGVFYLVWFGNTGATQSYYNLPALGPICGLFGIGAAKLLERVSTIRGRSIVSLTMAGLIIVPMVPIYRYLFQQDRPIEHAAEWVREHTRSSDAIIFRPNHRADMIDYPFNATLNYYTGRPTFVWTAHTPEKFKETALKTASYAVVTLPQQRTSKPLALINRFRRFELRPENTDWLEASGFRPVESQADFVAYTRAAP